MFCESYPTETKAVQCCSPRCRRRPICRRLYCRPGCKLRSRSLDLLLRLPLGLLLRLLDLLLRLLLCLPLGLLLCRLLTLLLDLLSRLLADLLRSEVEAGSDEG